jgi:serine/threonine-protein phosphatase 6 regulatory ankyrin repeat subunit B
MKFLSIKFLVLCASIQVQNSLVASERKMKAITKIDHDRIEITLENISPLIYLACVGNLDVLQSILNAKVDPDTIYDRRTALVVASQEGHDFIAKALLAAGADVNKFDGFGDLPLLAASESGHLPLVQQLLAARATVDRIGAEGVTPLFFACQNGHSQVAAALLAAGGNYLFVFRNNGLTPKTTALAHGHNDIVVLLKAHEKQQLLLFENEDGSRG